ncbi:MAG: hypothetical protein LIO86_00495 [Lachnospiraceae bacterium]|nr:hypothetical protein [Lachnospiraceae bacterium]
MNRRERMMAVVRGEPVDRLPVEITFADATVVERFAEHYKKTPEEFIDSLENDMRYAYTMDEVGCYMQDKEMLDQALKTGFAFPDPTRPYAYTDGFGITWDSSSVGQRPLDKDRDWEELENYTAPDPHKEGMFLDFDRKVGKFREEDYAFYAAQYYGPLEKFEHIRGFENAMMDFYLEEDNAEALWDKLADYRTELAKEICKRGVVFGHGGDDYGVQRGPLLSLEVWRKFIKPRLARIYKVYKDNGLPVLHHSCGNCSIFIDDLLEIGVDALHPIQASAMDIHELYKRYGDRIVYYGGFDMHSLMEKGTPAQIRANVKDTIETLGKNGRMVCCAVNIMGDVPFENFEALVDAIYEYRYIYSK